LHPPWYISNIVDMYIFQTLAWSFSFTLTNVKHLWEKIIINYSIWMFAIKFNASTINYWYKNQGRDDSFHLASMTWLGLIKRFLACTWSLAWKQLYLGVIKSYNTSTCPVEKRNSICIYQLFAFIRVGPTWFCYITFYEGDSNGLAPI